MAPYALATPMNKTSNILCNGLRSAMKQNVWIDLH